MTEEYRGIRVNEIYGVTFQAEGPFSGYKTLFLRTSGCNLRCPGWGVETELPNGKIVEGCDTPRAVFPQLYKDTPFKQPEEIIEMLRKKADVKRVCLTGGEPLFGDQKSINKLLDLLNQEGYEVDVFTNGTQDFSKIISEEDERDDDGQVVLNLNGSSLSWSWIWDSELEQGVPNPQHRRGFGRENLNFVVDFKMPGSGEYNPDDAKAIKQNKVFLYDNVKYLRPTDAIKFVIKNRQDFDTAVQEYHDICHIFDYSQKEEPPQFFVGAVFGLLDNDTLMDWVLESNVPFQFQFQAHKYDSTLDSKELEGRLDLPIVELKKPEPNKSLLKNIKGTDEYEGPNQG